MSYGWCDAMATCDASAMRASKLSMLLYINFIDFSISPYIIYMLDGCTLPNSLVAGVHNIPKQRLLMELEMRRIPIPKRGFAPSTRRACSHLMGKTSIGAHVAKYFNVQGSGNTLFLGSVLAFRDDNNGGMYTIHYEDGDREYMDTREFTTAYHRAKDEEV